MAFWKEKQEEKNLRLKQLAMETVENQLADNDPPATSETYARLIAEGNSEREAKEKIAAVALTHIFYVMHNQMPFDEELYRKDLDDLK